MRAIDADALTEIIHGMYAEGDNPSTYHVDAEGDTLIGKFAVVDAIFNMPTIQPDNNLQKLADEIASFKRHVKSDNSDYLTGYLCALSVVEGMIADMREVTT